MSETWDFEVRLRRALAPVEPPADLEDRLQTTLGSLVELAADELEAWELRAIKDPRNWPRAALGPAAAVVIGTGGARRPAHAQPPPQAPRAGARGARPGRAHAQRRGPRGAAGLPRRRAVIRSGP